MITAKLLREWSACWPDERITSHLGSRGEMSPREVASDESISIDDRLWVLCRSLWYLDESAARGFAIESAMLVSHLAGDEDDQAQHAALCAHLLEIEDLPEDQRAAAWDAAAAAYADAAAAYAYADAADADAAAAAYAYAYAYADADAAAYAYAYADADAWDAALKKAIVRALEWLGEYADGWEGP